MRDSSWKNSICGTKFHLQRVHIRDWLQPYLLTRKMNNASKRNASNVSSVLVNTRHTKLSVEKKVLQKTLLVTWFSVEISLFGLGFSYLPKRIIRFRRKTAKFVRRLIRFIFRNLQSRRKTHTDTTNRRVERLHKEQRRTIDLPL